MLIYKIFHPAEWDFLVAQGETLGAPVDLADGYIHLSTADQVQETAQRHFAKAGDLKLAAIEATSLQELRWEPSRGGADFPHLYRPLLLTDICWCRDLPQGNDGHIFPNLT